MQLEALSPGRGRAGGGVRSINNIIKEVFMSLFKKYYLYTKERFPIPPTFAYAAALYYLSYFFTNIIQNRSPFNLAESIIGCLVFYMALFEIRLLDEHKDYAKDVVAHPERMLSRGEITLADLRKLLYVMVALQTAMAIYLGPAPFAVWLAIQVFALFMFKEFFVPEFLNRHMGLYLLSHQVSVPLALLFGISQRADLCYLWTVQPLPFALFLFGTMMATINYEIARKTWSPDREHEQADSYTKVWGIGGAVIVNQIVALLAGASFLYFYITMPRSIVYTLIVCAAYLLFLATEIAFMAKRDSKTSKVIEMTGALYSLAMLITSAVFFFNMG